MIFTRYNDNCSCSNMVNQPMLLIYAPAPVSGQFVLQGFRFSNAGIRIFLNRIHEFFNSGIQFFITRFPFIKMGIGQQRKFNFPHLFFFLPISTVINSPLFACAMDSNNILRLARLDSRYSVSSCSSTVIEMFLLPNIFLSVFKKLSSNSIALRWNVVYINIFFLQK